jgi:hypothetical protein
MNRLGARLRGKGKARGRWMELSLKDEPFRVLVTQLPYITLGLIHTAIEEHLPRCFPTSKGPLAPELCRICNTDISSSANLTLFIVWAGAPRGLKLELYPPAFERACGKLSKIDMHSKLTSPRAY